MTISRISRGRILRIYLNDAESLLELETLDQSWIDIVHPETDELIPLHSLEEKKIRSVTLTFVDEGISADPRIHLRFYDDTYVILVATDRVTEIRIT